jgi:hypothetical protein
MYRISSFLIAVKMQIKLSFFYCSILFLESQKYEIVSAGVISLDVDLGEQFSMI